MVHIEEADLVVAQHPECQQIGVPVAQYLLTGETDGVAELEVFFAQQRADLLGQPDEARRSLAVAGAGRAIQQCDANKDDEAAAAAQQAIMDEQQRLLDQAAADALADYDALVQAANDEDAAYAAACTSRGARLDGGVGGVCVVDYPHPDSPFLVALNPDGSFNQGEANWQRQMCQQYQSDAQRDAADGYPWRRQPVYHPDTGVCEPGDF